MQQPSNVAAAMQEGAPVDEADPNAAADPMAEQDETPPEEDSAFVDAFNFVRKTLYEKGVADEVSTVMKSFPDPVPQLAEMAYGLTEQADTVTNGMVKEENLVSLGMYTLGEITEIADASGAELQSSDVASAFKSMLMRYLQENGADTGPLQEAMNQISPDQFNQLADAVPTDDEQEVTA